MELVDTLPLSPMSSLPTGVWGCLANFGPEPGQNLRSLEAAGDLGEALRGGSKRWRPHRARVDEVMVVENMHWVDIVIK